MLKNSALRRISLSTIAFITMMLICHLPVKESINIPSEVVYIKDNIIPIYVVDKNNYVARINVIKKDKDIIPYLISLLTISSNNSFYLPDGFTAIIPKDTKLLSYNLEDNLLKLNFSKEFLNVPKKDEEKLIESLIYTLCELDSVDKIMIFIENDKLLKLPNSNKLLPPTLNKDYGINKVFALDDIKDTTKTTIYFASKNNDELYYVPITKISNEKIEPVEIIIKELKSAPIYETNLISFLNASYELKDYEILENSISLSFDNNLLTNISKEDISEEVKYTLSLSLRDTYNINNITINAS